MTAASGRPAGCQAAHLGTLCPHSRRRWRPYAWRAPAGLAPRAGQRPWLRHEQPPLRGWRVSCLPPPHAGARGGHQMRPAEAVASARRRVRCAWRLWRPSQSAAARPSRHAGWPACQHVSRQCGRMNCWLSGAIVGPHACSCSLCWACCVPRPGGCVLSAAGPSTLALPSKHIFHCSEGF